MANADNRIPGHPVQSMKALPIFRSVLVSQGLYLLAALLLVCGKVAAQTPGTVIQINGVLMSADSLRAVPYATVSVRSQNRGVLSSEKGVFSVVVRRGDTLQFHSLGYRDKDWVVPNSLEGSHFSLIQLMVQDTFYLPETIVRPLPNKDNFNYAFVHWNIPDDEYELARKNTDELTLRALSYTLPRDGRENQSNYQNMQAYNAVYYGQQKPMNVMNPLAWAEFLDAWKRGDFRRK